MKNVLLAGLLGGLLGGAAGVVAGRYAPAVAAKPTAAPAPATAGEPNPRSIAEALLARLKEGKPEEFADVTKGSTHLITEEMYKQFKANLTDFRATYTRAFGHPLREFELVKEQPASPSLVRLVYLERFEKGGVLWFFVLYKGKDGWKLDKVHWVPDLALAFNGSS
jgi:hypothetical protein